MESRRARRENLRISCFFNYLKTDFDLSVPLRLSVKAFYPAFPGDLVANRFLLKSFVFGSLNYFLL